MADLLRSETSHQRASRIAPDFHHHKDPVQRFRSLIILICALSAIGYLLYGFFFSGSDQRFSHGPVVAAHAGFESQCSACHVDFQTIRDDAWAASWTDAKRLTDVNCNRCHPTSGHHAGNTLPETLTNTSCTFCHFEHKGRDADISRVADRACLSCHNDLNRVRAHSGVDQPIAASVRRFSASAHPEFRSLQSDPGNVKFNHRLHLTPGIVRNSGDRGKRRLSDLSPQYRAKYRQPNQREDDLIELDCSSCHEPDYDVRSETAEGAFMKPIAFEQHCAACHALNYEWTEGQEEAPHGLTYRELTEHFEQKHASAFIAANPDLKREPAKVPNVPGKAADSSPSIQEATRFVQERTANVLRSLKIRCAQCHDQDDETKDIVKPHIPQRWFTHGRFNHHTHRGVSCQDCHPQTSEDKGSSSSDRDTVMILGRDKCLSCHNSDRGGSAARHACVNCHRYHVDPPPTVVPASVGGDDPLSISSLREAARD